MRSSQNVIASVRQHFSIDDGVGFSLDQIIILWYLKNVAGSAKPVTAEPGVGVGHCCVTFAIRRIVVERIANTRHNIPDETPPFRGGGVFVS